LVPVFKQGDDFDYNEYEHQQKLDISRVNHEPHPLRFLQRAGGDRTAKAMSLCGTRLASARLYHKNSKIWKNSDTKF
ncbi:MAG: hypothetical protein LBK04_05820, partial [Clostridiales Family XIII bacterium]|nr:hypothetical protein [Clostridiales Family XIII bacterium]